MVIIILILTNSRNMNVMFLKHTNEIVNIYSVFYVKFRKCIFHSKNEVFLIKVLSSVHL